MEVDDDGIYDDDDGTFAEYVDDEDGDIGDDEGTYVENEEEDICDEEDDGIDDEGTYVDDGEEGALDISCNEGGEDGEDDIELYCWFCTFVVEC